MEHLTGEGTRMSFSISFFEHHPDISNWPAGGNVAEPDNVDPASPDDIVDAGVLDRHSAMIAPRKARLWLHRGAALVALWRQLTRSVGRR